MPDCPKAREYAERLRSSGKLSKVFHDSIQNDSPELRYIEFFLTHLIDTTGGREKAIEALEQIPDNQYVDMAHHHWRSFMSELTAYWLLEGQFGWSIDGFDISSPKRIRKNSVCDACCTSGKKTHFVEVKSAHDWTRFHAPQSIVTLCKNDPRFSYVIWVSRPRFKASDEFLKHVELELINGKKYLESIDYDASYDIHSDDNRYPHDLTITIDKRRNDSAPTVSFIFPPKDDADFPTWMENRVAEATDKGASLLMLNYIFWMEVGDNPDLKELLTRRLGNLRGNKPFLRLELDNPGSVEEVVVFLPSGEFATIEIVPAVTVT
ncbi:MAG TPA: hypothetical protein VI215_00900 [Bacteroidota bacterium]